MKDSIITYSRGPQFRGGGTAALFFFLLTLVLISIAGIVNGEYIAALVLSPFILLLSFFIFDIRGTQVNMDKGLVREYKLFLWFKMGKWKNYNPFNLIILKYVSHHIDTADFSKGRFGDTATEVHGIFTVFLTNQEETNSIVIAEFSEYHDALNFAYRISEELNLPLLDKFEIRLESSRNRRRR